MLRTAIYSVCVGLLLASAANADVYKYTDEKGNVQYTDTPTLLPAERLNIQSLRTDVVELEKREDAEAKAATERNKSRQQSGAGSDKKKAEELSETKKAETCAKAREDYRVRTTNWRLYETDAKGERRYLSAPEIDASRDAAKKAMDELCK